MNTLREILGDRLVNSFIVGLLLGISTLNFVNVTGAMAINTWLKTGNSNVWVWKNFWGDFILYLCVIISAIIVRKFVKK